MLHIIMCPSTCLVLSWLIGCATVSNNYYNILLWLIKFHYSMQ